MRIGEPHTPPFFKGGRGGICFASVRLGGYGKSPPPPLCKRGECAPQSGFTLLGLLFLITVLGLLLAVVGSTWSSALQREKEAQLLFIGDQYRHALGAYYRKTPGGEKHYPKKLEELILDPRFPNTVRHLRQLWPDPVSGGDWVLLRDENGGINGLHSPAETTPRKTANFPKEHAEFENADRYADWVFMAEK